MAVELEEITTDGAREEKSPIDTLVDECKQEVKSANIPHDLQFEHHVVEEEPEKVWIGFVFYLTSIVN